MAKMCLALDPSHKKALHRLEKAKELLAAEAPKDCEIKLLSSSIRAPFAGIEPVLPAEDVQTKETNEK